MVRAARARRAARVKARVVGPAMVTASASQRWRVAAVVTRGSVRASRLPAASRASYQPYQAT
ncbi:hypothetical protein Vwe01_07510 [Micromonospora andamanensis]|nr:hypothetical protein Vwe01_07510 [Micromonospora andamanensis]